MNLLIDIGNTFTHICISGKARILYDFIIPTHVKPVQEDVLKKIHKYRNKIENSAVSSVVPAKDNSWRIFIEKFFKIHPLFISNKTPLPVKIKIENPASIGADRICNAVAGYNHFKDRDNVIIIDFGTATTYDVILKNGYFTGGIIAPGIETSAASLHRNTGKLPMLTNKQFRFPGKVVGRNTLEAIQSGLMYSASITVDGMIGQIEKEYKRKFKIILTGGFAKLIYRRINHKVKLEKNMVLKGLNQIIYYNNSL